MCDIVLITRNFPSVTIRFRNEGNVLKVIRRGNFEMRSFVPSTLISEYIFRPTN